MSDLPSRNAQWLAALLQWRGDRRQCVNRAGTWLALSTPPKMLITLAGMATTKPYLPVPSAFVRNCTWKRQHQLEYRLCTWLPCEACIANVDEASG